MERLFLHEGIPDIIQTCTANRNIGYRHSRILRSFPREKRGVDLRVVNLAAGNCFSQQRFDPAEENDLSFSGRKIRTPQAFPRFE